MLGLISFSLSLFQCASLSFRFARVFTGLTESAMASELKWYDTSGLEARTNILGHSSLQLSFRKELRAERSWTWLWPYQEMTGRKHGRPVYSLTMTTPMTTPGRYACDMLAEDATYDGTLWQKNHHCRLLRKGKGGSMYWRGRNPPLTGLQAIYSGKCRQ